MTAKEARELAEKQVDDKHLKRILTIIEECAKEGLCYCTIYKSDFKAQEQAFIQKQLRSLGYEVMSQNQERSTYMYEDKYNVEVWMISW